MKKTNKFSKIILISIIGFILLILLTIGGIFYLKNAINNQFNPPKPELMQRAAQLGDFSKIPEGYGVTKALNIMGVTAVVGEYSKTGQYMAIVNPEWSIHVTKNDIQTGILKHKLMDYAAKVNSPNIKLNNLEIEPKGSFTAFNQSVPYVKAKITLSSVNSRKISTKKNYEGIIGIIENPKTGKSELIVSLNSKGKFSQKVAENFFKKVKIN